MIAHEQADANVTPLQGNLTSGRMPRRERRTKEADLVQWRLRLAASTQALDDLRSPEFKRINRAEAKVTSRLAGLMEAQQQRAGFFAVHPEVARRLDSIDGEVQALDVAVEGPTRGTHVERGRMGDPPWMRKVLTTERSLDIGLGL